MKIMKSQDKSVKVILGLIVLLLVYIAYKLFTGSSPTTELDCLKLGSNERAAACIRLIKENEPKISQKSFPLGNLILSDVQAQNTNYCINVSGSIKNTSDVEASDIMLRIDFSKVKNEQSFHYEIFSPFQLAGERVQPQSSKSFSTCLRSQSFNIMNNLRNWYFGVSVFSANVYNKN